MSALKTQKIEPVPPDRIFSVSEAANFLKIRPSTIYSYVFLRKIPFFKGGGDA